jgi:trans-aconitate methyltransferase
MKRKIRSYDDLEREEQLLEELLQAQKNLVQLDIQQLRNQLKPAAMALQFFNKITTVDKSNPLLNQGANTAIDFLLKKVVLARAGWITKLLVPLVVKNYSSHFIADHKQDFVQKLFSLFSGKNGKAKAASTVPGNEN